MEQQGQQQEERPVPPSMQQDEPRFVQMRMQMIEDMCVDGCVRKVGGETRLVGFAVGRVH